MSRRALHARIEFPDFDVVVGWDRPFATFFAQVFEPGAEIPRVDRGGPGDPIARPDRVLHLVAPYAVVPHGLEHQLLNDSLTD